MVVVFPHQVCHLPPSIQNFRERRRKEMRPRPPLHRRPLTYIPLLLIPPIYYISDTRSLRTLKTAITLAIALKHPTTPFSHENAAEAIEKLVAKNGGLYIKYAQAMAMQGEILPRCYKERLARFMDGATPSMECEEVRITVNEKTKEQN